MVVYNYFRMSTDRQDIDLVNICLNPLAFLLSLKC